MNRLKNVGFILFLFAVMAVLVISRIFNPNLFKRETQAAIENALNTGFVISEDQLKTKNNPYLLVDLNHTTVVSQDNPENSVHIPFEKLLDKTSQDILKNNNGEIVLVATDNTTSSKAWVILNQLGYKNVIILEKKQNQEVLKYKFQPDTIIRLESVQN